MSDEEFKIEWAETHESVEELAAYIDGLVNQEHDYNTSGYAMAQAAVAAFNFVASRLGVTGFQASCAALAVYGKLMSIDGPFGVVMGEEMLYPQYDLGEQVAGWQRKWTEWASGEAKKMLAESDPTFVNHRVWAHWEMLAAK